MKRLMEEFSKKIIDGRKIAKIIRNEVKADVEKIIEKYKTTPKLTVILIGNRADSATYVRMKEKAAKEVNIEATDIKLDENVSEESVLNVIHKLNKDKSVHAILVQLPLPKHINESKVLEAVAVEKDVDGFSAINVGNMCLKGGAPPLAVACTPGGIVELLQRSVEENYDFKGKHAVVIGRSNIVGMPISQLLLSMDCTVTVCHSRTVDISNHVKRADIVVAAVGRTEFVKGDWIKEGAIVIDVGINSVEDKTKKRGYRLVGDVEYAEAIKRCGKITPVPGGVGPMTIAMLLSNTVNLTRASLGLERRKLRQNSYTH